jgi:hypothetical protein
LLEAEQVAMKFSPEGDPTLVWGRPAGRLPVTFFQVLRLNILAPIYLIIMGKKSREMGRIFGEKLAGRQKKKREADSQPHPPLEDIAISYIQKPKT